MTDSYRIRRQRRWPIVLLVLLTVVCAGWAGAWHYGAGVAERTIDGWKAREAKAGRVYSCATQSIGGFPFGIEVHCTDPGADLKSNTPPLTVKARDMLVSAHVWRPTVLTTEFAAPLTVSEPGRAVTIQASWRHAQTQVRGLPTSPESVSINLDQPVVNRIPDNINLFKANKLDLDGHLLSGTVQDHPVIEIMIRLAGGSAPSWHPAAATPVDADITAVLRGLKDFAPEPWPQRFRELQAAGGRIEISKARIQQRDTIAIADGTLGLTPAGRLNGQLNLTVANLEQFLPALGLDKMLAPERAPPKVNDAFNKLDRLLPGLGNVARQNAAPMITAGIGMMGQPTELEGKRAVSLPLRFDDGVVSLGPLTIGMVPALF